MAPARHAMPSPPPAPRATPQGTWRPGQPGHIGHEAGLGHPVVLGLDPGQLDLGGGQWVDLVGKKQRLEREVSVLPELDGQIAPRPLHRQPVFVVSIILAVIMLITCAALVIYRVTHRPQATAAPPTAVAQLTVVARATVTTDSAALVPPATEEPASVTVQRTTAVPRLPH